MPDWRLHPAGQLGQQDLARRQRGQSGDVVGADRPVPSTPPVIRTTLAYGRVASRTAFAVPASSVPNAIAVGPIEQRTEGLADRVFGGDPHQAVLDHAVGHVLLAQGAPDLGDLLHLEAAVLGDDHRPGVGEFLAQLGDGLPFGLRRHMHSSFLRHATGVRGGYPNVVGWPLRRPWSPSVGRPTPARRGAAHPEVERHRSASACSSSSPARPSRVADRSGPADQAPTVTTSIGRRSASAGCLRRSSRLGQVTRLSAATAAGDRRSPVVAA